ncbi:hypothetical protein PBRA_003375 [Plasmodiophora brassicae]|uniref:Uncharacterized protein n=1 Tax=Plasmodiophora brassicae TaxID=37360 RepID=A0A0G4J831_PLABS|nr:hypothetical protein PBRA_003375 [Plasmodiophora brassicae]
MHGGNPPGSCRETLRRIARTQSSCFIGRRLAIATSCSGKGMRHQAHVLIPCLPADIVSEKEYHQFLYSISPGFQEYVEAEAFLHYLNHGTLVTKDEIQLGLLRCNADLVRISLTTHDYLLGIADLSGEVMRFAVGCASSGNFDGVKHACVFMRKLLAKCEYLSGMGRVKDWPGKVEVMRSSTIKVEIALYKLYLQKLEFPDRPLTLSSDAFERSSDQRESIGCT